MRARLLAAALLALFAVQAVSSLVTKSATWDETHYFGVGRYLIRTLRWDVPSSILHPPLAYYLDSLPLLLAHLDDSVWTYPPGTQRDTEFLQSADVGRGQTLLSSTANNGDRLLTAARLMVVAQALLLGWFVFRLASELYGPTAGVVATMLFAFCPNMLANAGLITPDMTVTTTCFIAMFYFRSALKQPGWRNVTFSGLALGLALLSKFTALLLLPIQAAIAVIQIARGRPVALGRLCASFGIGGLLLFAGYAFDLAPYVAGIGVQHAHAQNGHDAFLMGTLGTGWWYYLPVAIAIKTPIPLLIFAGAAAALLGARAFARNVSLDDLCLWLPIVGILAFFCVERQSIGLRYVLPIYPFAFVLASGAVVRLRRLRYVAAAGLIWYIAGTVMIRPDYLAYFNELAGGPSQGQRYLVDSNIDWGQDLKGLKAFMDAKGIDRIYLSYFGTDSPERYGIAYDWLPSYVLANPDSEHAEVGIARHRYLAISKTNLQGVYMTPPTMFRWLDRYTPVADIGHSILVYYLE